jgi:hypothetical protein
MQALVSPSPCRFPFALLCIALLHVSSAHADAKTQAPQGLRGSRALQLTSVQDYANLLKARALNNSMTFPGRGAGLGVSGRYLDMLRIRPPAGLAWSVSDMDHPDCEAQRW